MATWGDDDGRVRRRWPPIALAADRDAVRQLRAEVRSAVAAWGGDDATDIQLVSSELATNAIAQTGAPVEVWLSWLGGAVRIEVLDQSPSLPVADVAGAPGSQLIYEVLDHVALGWGWTPAPIGKAVWVELDLRAGPAGSD